MNAQELAKTLASRFLQEGNYDALGSSFGSSLTPAAFSTSPLDGYFDAQEGFSGLAVRGGLTSGARG